MSVQPDDGYSFIRANMLIIFVAIYNSAVLRNMSKCLYIVSCEEDYCANVMSSLLSFPNGRNQIFIHGKHQKKYRLVYVSRGVLEGDLEGKRYWN